MQCLVLLQTIRKKKNFTKKSCENEEKKEWPKKYDKTKIWNKKIVDANQNKSLEL